MKIYLYWTSSHFYVSSDCRCGVKKSSRIVGGTTVNDPVTIELHNNCSTLFLILMLFQINKYPWIVSIQRTSDSSHICGGSLVASKYVVTSARCLYWDTNPYMESDIQVHFELRRSNIRSYTLEVTGIPLTWHAMLFEF